MNHTQRPTTQTLNITTTRARLTSLVKQVFLGEQRIIIEKSGIPVAAIISARDAERFAEFERQRQGDFAAMDELRESFAHIPIDEHEREVARAVSEARAELRRERGTEQSPPSRKA